MRITQLQKSGKLIDDESDAELTAQVDNHSDYVLHNSAQELRNQFRAEKEIPLLPAYPGKNGGIDPLTFLEQTYGQYISQGNFGPGQLALKDRALYAAIGRRLAASSPPRTMQEYFSAMREDGLLATPTDRKYRACAAILGTTPDEAARFFGNMRRDRAISPERISQQTEKRRDGRSGLSDH